MPSGTVGDPMTGPVISEDVWGILCIFAEARGEPLDGQIAVGQVIRNRTKARLFSKGTICSTVTWPSQFSWLNTNDPQRSRVFGVVWEDPAWEIAKNAWFQSEHRNLVDGATHYYADTIDPPWWSKHMTQVVKIGRHVFLK